MFSDSAGYGVQIKEGCAGQGNRWAPSEAAQGEHHERGPVVLCRDRHPTFARRRRRRRADRCRRWRSPLWEQQVPLAGPTLGSSSAHTPSHSTPPIPSPHPIPPNPTQPQPQIQCNHMHPSTRSDASRATISRRAAFSCILSPACAGNRCNCSIQGIPSPGA